MFSRKKTTISTDRCWDEGRKTATENSVEKVSGGAPEPAVRESRDSEAACKIAALRDNGNHNAALTAAPAEVMCGDTAEPAGHTPRDSDATRKNTNSRDNGSHNAALTAAPDTWLSGEAATMADSLKRLIDQADVVVIGAGAGLSTSAGFTYSGARFRKYFADFEQKYGFHDMYCGGFYPYRSLEEYWAYWSRYIWINRYMDAPEPVYDDLLKLVERKDYFVLTTNVDHCFQKAGFDKTRLFYTQGDYGLWQCSKPCHHKTYDNRDGILKMLRAQGAVPDRDGDIMTTGDHIMKDSGDYKLTDVSGPDNFSWKGQCFSDDPAGVGTVTLAEDRKIRDPQDNPEVSYETGGSDIHGAGHSLAQAVSSAILRETGLVSRCDGSSGPLKMEIPSELVPRCPVCGRPMTMNLRADGSFVEDDGWHEAAARYSAFLEHHRKGRVVYLELGVGGNTPVIIKYPFWKMTAQNRDAVYACINLGETGAPADIRRRSICIDADIGKAIKHMLR